MRDLGEKLLAAFVILGMIFLVIFGIIQIVNWNNHHQTERGRGDAPTGNINVDKREVYQMPDAFSNVAMFCDKYGNAVYVTTKTDNSRGVWALKDGCQ
jgi:hypothetical protein